MAVSDNSLMVSPKTRPRDPPTKYSGGGMRALSVLPTTSRGVGTEKAPDRQEGTGAQPCDSVGHLHHT